MIDTSTVHEMRAPAWLIRVLNDTPAARRVHRLWQWMVVSLSCLSGCANWGQVADNATQPLRAAGNLLGRAGDRFGDVFEWHSTQHRNPRNLPAHQGQMAELARQSAPLQSPPSAAATTQAGAFSLPISQPTATQAIHNTPSAAEKPPESLSVPSAPPAVEILPAPSAELQSISHSRSPALPVQGTAAIASSTMNSWCRVRIRNVSQQSVSKVAVTVNSPESVPLVSKEGDAVSAPVTGKMEFAPVAQVGSQEEVILVIGVGTNQQPSHRLRVQVRDGMGGSNQDVQARWQVSIEAIE